MTLSNGGNQARQKATDDRTGGLADRPQAIALVLLGGLLLRVVIAYLIAPGQGLQADLDYFTNAALTLADYGPGGFVAHNGFYQPSPVGYLYFLWPLGLAGRFLGGILGQPADGMTLALLKVPAILADLGIAMLLYRAGRRWFGSRAGLIAAALYLFVPMTWYESALFGQVDSVGLLFVVAALLLLFEGWSEPAVAMAVLSAVIKPQNAICLVVIVPVLLRRHLFVMGSGPVPARRSRNAVLDRILVGWFAKRQGFERLVSSAVVAVAVFVIAILPFDLQLLAPPDLVSIPVIGQVSGFISLIGSLADYYHVLTANAFNTWALVGPIPLYSELSRTFIWTFDSLQVVGPIQAVTIGAGLLLVVTASVAAVLLLRDDRPAILGSLTVLALAFFALPTRAHERYLFPVFVTFALLVAGSTLSERRWRWWYIALGVLAAVNLHAVVTLAQPGFASPGLIGAPLGDLFRTDAAVIAVSLANTVLFGVLLVAWARGIALPILAAVAARIAGRGTASWVPQRPVVATSSAAAGVDVLERQAAGRVTSEPVALEAAVLWVSRLAAGLSRPVRSRLNAGSPPADNSAALSSEPGGHLDRRDLLVLIAILVVTFAVRTYRIETPRGVYFDELYYPATGTEFLQDWRYGIHTEIFEWTHPHVSKYVQALSIAAFGNDRAVSVSSVGAPVRAVAFEPAFFAPETATRYGGDLIAIATGSEVRIAPHGLFARAAVVPLPGAALVSFDGATHRLYVADDGSGVWAIDGSAIDAALNGGAAPQPVPVASLQGQITTLRVIDRDRVVAVTDGDQLSLIDGQRGQTLATASLPGLSSLISIPVGESKQLVVAVPQGLKRLDANSLQELSSIGLPTRPLGMEFVEGSDFGWRNQATLPTPTIYAALDSSQMAAVQVGGDGSLSLFDLFAMPGPVIDAHWDRPSNMVHVLGQTPTGDPTIYVVEPHTDSVFADARLPFKPVAWVLDVQPDTPSLDRQQALTFSASGTVVYVDTGSHAWAWRVPGVVAGTLSAALMYLLARMLFRRRMVGLLLAVVMALDSLLFIQGRIAMNDSLLGFFIVAAFTLLLVLMQARPRGLARWLLPIFGLPAVGILLGLALGTKWVGVYAIGGAVLLVLARTQAGRWLALAGMILLTGVFGFQALAGQPPNVTFLLLMLGLTVFVGIVVVRPPDHSSASDVANLPGWVNPSHRFGVPFAFALACLVIVPLVVYVVSYIPWTLSATGDPQLFPGWPPGHTGQTFLDLQSQMYHYHNDLRIPHAASSPWWAWPLGLKPVWGHFNTYSDGSQVLMLLTANPVLLWLGIPAVAFGAWQAWRRRSTALAFVLIAMCALWLPWARIDRVAYNYHWYTVLPFYYLLLAYFLAELWNGPSPRTWSLARVAVATVLVLPAVMWLLKDSLCALAGVGEINPTSFECNRSLLEVALPVGLWLIGSIVAAWFILGMQKPRRLVAVAIVAAALGFAVLYPALSALPIPNGWPYIYQGLLPTWDISFRFNSNTSPVSDVALLGFGPVVVATAAVALTWLAMRRMQLLWARGQRPKPPTPKRSDQPAAPYGETLDDHGPQVSYMRPVDFRVGVEGELDASQPVPAPARQPSIPPAPGWPAARTEKRPGESSETQQRDMHIGRYGIAAGLFLLAAAVYALVNHGRPATLDYFVPLADAFLHGQTALSAVYSWMGELVYGPNGLYNVVYPPAPAIVVMLPVLLLGPDMEQAWASILVGAANVAVMSLVLGEIGISGRTRILLSLVFAFGTIVWFSAQVGTAWHFAQVCSIFFLLLAILGCLRNARTWVIGLLFAGAVLSRLPVIGAAPFFLLYLADRTSHDHIPERISSGNIGRVPLVEWARRIDPRMFIRKALPMALGLAVPLALYGAYNSLRFGSPFENGYALIPGLANEEVYRNGFFSLQSIPDNLRVMFLSMPPVASEPPWVQPRLLGGISILLTTPLFIWSLNDRSRDWITLGSWLSIALILIPIVLHGDTGGEQFGFRYAQDFYPFLFLLAVRGLRGRIGPIAWVAITIGFAVNLWGMAAAYFNWWA